MFVFYIECLTSIFYVTNLKQKELFSVAKVKLASQANFTGNFETKAQNLGMRPQSEAAADLATFRKVRFTLNALNDI